jgi:hypothetical protein
MSDDGNEDQGLAAAAGGALDDDDGYEGQQNLPGTNYSRVKFVGMAWETAEVPSLKTEVEFTVRGIVVGHGEEVMADGTVREVAKVKVQSVTQSAL